MKKYVTFTLFLTLAVSLALFNSCRKKKDTIARITVLDAENNVVPEAQVILFGQSTTDPMQEVVRRDTAMTNTSGVATFNYNDVYQLGQAGVAVLNIRATKGGLVGTGIIQIEQEKENTARVFIQAN
jgi:hypothetical protein